MKTLSFAAMLLASSAAAHADALAFPDRDRAAVVDAAHVLPANVVASLNQRIVAWDKATGHQFVVGTVPSLQGQDIATYGYQLGRAWGLGRKGINDGAILLLAPTERKVRIEVGRGLEGDLTDAETSEIIHGAIVPRLKAGECAWRSVRRRRRGHGRRSGWRRRRGERAEAQRSCLGLDDSLRATWDLDRRYGLAALPL